MSTSNSDIDDNKSKLCWNCGKQPDSGGKPLQRCCRCQMAKYCGRDCQAANWKTHKKECTQLQSQKLSKAEKKANDSMLDGVAAVVSDQLNDIVSLMSEQTERLGSCNPRLLELSRDMKITLAAAEHIKRDDKKADSSWLTDPEKRKTIMDAMQPSPQLVKMIEHVRENRDQYQDNPISDSTQTVEKYLNIFGVEAKEKPHSMDEIIQKIEPALEALDVFWNNLRASKKKCSDAEYGAKVRKLRDHVTEMKSMKPSDQAAYTRDSLATMEKLWRARVSELWMLSTSGLYGGGMMG